MHCLRCLCYSCSLVYNTSCDGGTTECQKQLYTRCAAPSKLVGHKTYGVSLAWNDCLSKHCRATHQTCLSAEHPYHWELQFLVLLAQLSLIVAVLESCGIKASSMTGQPSQSRHTVLTRDSVLGQFSGFGGDDAYSHMISEQQGNLLLV